MSRRNISYLDVNYMCSSQVAVLTTNYLRTGEDLRYVTDYKLPLTNYQELTLRYKYIHPDHATARNSS